MSMRSDVGITMTKYASDRFNAELAAADPETQSAVAALMASAGFTSENRYGDMLFIWEDICWDPDGFVHRFVCNMADNGHEAEVCLIRIGEDLDEMIDIIGEMDANPFEMGVVRKLVYKA